MLSAAYRRSSVAARDQLSRDPENRWLGRFSPRRLDAEEVRDALLFVSGQLDRTPGGPAADGIDSKRRSLYVQTARWDRSSFAMLFDAANPDASTEKRTVSTVAPQALLFLNHPFVLRRPGAWPNGSPPRSPATASLGSNAPTSSCSGGRPVRKR